MEPFVLGVSRVRATGGEERGVAKGENTQAKLRKEKWVKHHHKLFLAMREKRKKKRKPSITQAIGPLGKARTGPEKPPQGKKWSYKKTLEKKSTVDSYAEKKQKQGENSGPCDRRPSVFRHSEKRPRKQEGGTTSGGKTQKENRIEGLF